jgi:hypothetical protein
MKATPKRLRAIYRFLQEMPPFDRWDLPPSNLVRFVVHSDPQEHGHYRPPEDDERMHTVAINVNVHVSLIDHIQLVAHEMGHMRQSAIGKLPDTYDQTKMHGVEWQRIARVICDSLGFRPAEF